MYSRSFMSNKIHYVSVIGKPTDTFCVVPNGARVNYYMGMKKTDAKAFEKPRWAYIAESIMEERGITQESLVPVFGKKTRGAIGHYFTGRRQPDVNQLLALAKHFGISLSELAGEVPLAPDSEYKQEADRLFRETSPEGHSILVGALRGVASQLPRRNNEDS